jgi:hypothetical protein
MTTSDDCGELTPLTDDDLEKGREAVEPAARVLLVGTSARALNRARDIVRNGIAHVRTSAVATRDVVERFAIGIYTVVFGVLAVVLVSAAAAPKPPAGLALLTYLSIALVVPIVLYASLWHRQRLSELTDDPGPARHVDLAKLRLHEHEVDHDGRHRR